MVSVLPANMVNDLQPFLLRILSYRFLFSFFIFYRMESFLLFIPDFCPSRSDFLHMGCCSMVRLLAAPILYPSKTGR